MNDITFEDSGMEEFQDMLGSYLSISTDDIKQVRVEQHLIHISIHKKCG